VGLVLSADIESELSFTQDHATSPHVPCVFCGGRVKELWSVGLAYYLLEVNSTTNNEHEKINLGPFCSGSCRSFCLSHKIVPVGVVIVYVKSLDGSVLRSYATHCYPSHSSPFIPSHHIVRSSRTLFWTLAFLINATHSTTFFHVLRVLHYFLLLKQATNAPRLFAASHWISCGCKRTIRFRTMLVQDGIVLLRRA
jgi:hypothetical protein